MAIESHPLTEGEQYAVLYEVEDVVKLLPNVSETKVIGARRKCKDMQMNLMARSLQERFWAAAAALDKVLAEGRCWI